MLSRIAEALFWIGRYVERADDTARLLDVHIQMLSEDPWAEEDLVCRSLLSVMDRPVPAAGTLADRHYVLQSLAYDDSCGSAISGALIAARENARRAREIISTELWEALNATWNLLPTQLGARPHDFFVWVRERAALVAGVIDSTIPRDETWSFLILGRSIERADMTARLLTTQALTGGAGPDPITFLRSCGAHEAFLKTYRGAAAEDRAVEFVLLDRLFPRSVVHALAVAESALNQIEPTAVRTAHDDAQRHLGRARTLVEYQPLAEIVDRLPEEMEQVQRACAAACDAIAHRYFPAGAAKWVGETL